MIKLRFAIMLFLILIEMNSPTVYAVVCSIQANSMPYGNYGGLYNSPAVYHTSTFTIKCNNNDSTTFCPHLNSLPNPADPVKDHFCLDSACNNIISSTSTCLTSDGSPVVMQCKNGCTSNIYGYLPAGQIANPAMYSSIYRLNLDVNGAMNQSTSAFKASVTIVASAAVSASNFAFGNYSPSNSTDQQSAQTNVHVVATKTTPYKVSLSAGSSGNVAQRTMKQSTNILNYNFYLPISATTCAYSSIWPATNGLAGTGDGTLQDILVCGAIAHSQYVAAGNYTDTIIATVTY